MFFKSDLMIYNRRSFLWLLLFMFGLISNQSDARAVNISNTWTLPHDGFTVFYRFFRDQISWFEADAVCQFHHANLVTVTNSVEFDASREFLRVLDVSEPVWIGLMRSQNSDRFFWSNSKPLGFTNEYWAESLPVIDAPLCAVIDPIRDYRWHALRCGGPETASFLCEMNVPSWAEECVIRDIPSLTIQYMADSGTVEITKYCGNDEDIIHEICRGKQDLGRITRRLVCKNEKRQQEISQNFNNQRKNLILNSDILDSHKKSIEIIKSAETDNKEDNNISIMNNKEFYPMQEKLVEEETENPVQKLIEQFNVEELMQADQPQRDESQSKQTKNLILPHVIITPKEDTKKSSKNQNKKLKFGEKKTNKNFSHGGQKKKLRGKNIAIEDIMMGDQPFIPFSEIDNLNEIQELLPHSKKMLPQDLKHEDPTFVKEKSINKNVKDKQSPTVHSDLSLQTGRSAISESTKDVVETVNDETITTGASPISITSELSGEDMESVFKSNASFNNETHLSILKSESERITLSSLNGNSDSESTTIITPPHSSDTTISSSDIKLTSAVTIGHPMHPQQPRSNVVSEEIVHQHIKESNDNHFIPPMLMVKSHYQSPKSGLGHIPEHQLDLQIVRKKTSPTDVSSNDDISHHLDKQSTDFEATTQWDGIIELQNNFQKLESTNVSLSGKNISIHPAVQNKYLNTFNESEQMTNNISALTTRAIKSTSSEETKVSDDNTPKLEVSSAATIAPNQKIEIKLSNFTTANQATYSSSFMPGIDPTEKMSQIKKPFDERRKILTSSLTISLPMESNDKLKDSMEIDTKTRNSTNLANIKILSVYPLLFVNKSTGADLKGDLSTILTTIVEKPSSIITFSDESFKKDENKLLTNNTKIVPDSESKTFITEEKNNLTIIVSPSKSNQEYQGNMRNNINKNKNYNGEEKEHLQEEFNQSTAIAEKGLVSDKEAMVIEKEISKNDSKPLSSFVVLTTTVSSATPISLSIEEELEEPHDGTKKSTTASDTYTSDEENFQPHKPNRRRTLTKPETTSYLKKILG